MLQIWYTPDGMYVDEMAINPQMSMITDSKANVYRPQFFQLINGKMILEQIPEARQPKLKFDCTVRFDDSQDKHITVALQKKTMILFKHGTRSKVSNKSNERTKDLGSMVKRLENTSWSKTHWFSMLLTNRLQKYLK